MHTMLAAAILAAAFAGAADPDFKGTWVLNRDESDNIRSLPAPAAPRLIIEHRGVSLRVTEATGPKPTVFSYTTVSKESRTKVGDLVTSSILKWEGAALLFNTIVNAPSRSYTQMDRWRLSRDGATLTIRCEIVHLHGSVRATLVYDRAPGEGSGPGVER